MIEVRRIDGEAIAILGDLTVNAAEQLQTDLATIDVAGHFPPLDLSRVGEVDTAGVQVLLAFMSQASQGTCQVVAASSTLMELVEAGFIPRVFAPYQG